MLGKIKMVKKKKFKELKKPNRKHAMLIGTVLIILALAIIINLTVNDNPEINNAQETNTPTPPVVTTPEVTIPTTTPDDDKYPMLINAGKSGEYCAIATHLQENYKKIIDDGGSENKARSYYLGVVSESGTCEVGKCNYATSKCA